MYWVNFKCFFFCEQLKYAKRADQFEILQKYEKRFPAKSIQFVQKKHWQDMKL